MKRNLFTFLLVIDPSKADHYRPIPFLVQLLSSGLPVRIGVLLVDEHDVRSSRLDDKFYEKKSAPNALSSREMALILKFVVKKGNMLALNLLMLWEKEISKAKNLLPSKLELLHLYADLMSQIQPQTNKVDVLKEITSFLSEASESDLYEERIEFTKRKGIVPGMVFMNGRILAKSSDDFNEEEIANTLYDEQHRLLQMVMEGIVSDSKPRSIYLSLLKGSMVYEKYHPLFMQDSSSQVYVSKVSHYNNHIYAINDSAKIVYIIDFFLSDQASMYLDKLLGDLSKIMSDAGEDIGFKVWMHSTSDLKNSLKNETSGNSCVALNGRLYCAPESQSISVSDIEVLFKLESEQVKAIHNSLAPVYLEAESRDELHLLVAELGCFMGELSRHEKDNIDDIYLQYTKIDSKIDQFKYIWNKDDAKDRPKVSNCISSNSHPRFLNNCFPFESLR